MQAVVQDGEVLFSWQLRQATPLTLSILVQARDRLPHLQGDCSAEGGVWALFAVDEQSVTSCWRKARRCSGPLQVAQIDLRPSVDPTSIQPTRATPKQHRNRRGENGTSRKTAVTVRAHHASSAVGHYITGSRQPMKFMGRRLVAVRRLRFG
jgi:hypothetical protein